MSIVDPRAFKGYSPNDLYDRLKFFLFSFQTRKRAICIVFVQL